jgi:AsmA protein
VSGRMKLSDHLAVDGVSGLSLQSGEGFLRGFALPDLLGPLQISGAFSSRNDGFQISAAQVKAGGFVGTGGVGLNWAGFRPKLALNLDSLALTATEQNDSAKSAAFWSEQPLDLSGFESFDADVSAALKASALGPGKIQATLKNGLVQLTGQFADAGGGVSGFELAAKLGGEEVQISALVDGKGVDLSTLWPKQFSAGKANVAAALTSNGRSIAGLLATLQGTTSLTIADASVLGLAIPKLLSSGENIFKSIAANFKVSDGIAATDTVTAATKNISFSGSGEIDILRQALAFELVAKPKTKTADQIGGLSINGPWTAPRITVKTVLSETAN